MKIRFLVIATAMALASAPSLADWAKVKAAASELGSAVSDTSKEAWQSVTDFSKATWASVSQWGSEAFNTAGAWTDKSVATGKEWLTVADKKLDEMLEPKTADEARLALSIPWPTPPWCGCSTSNPRPSCCLTRRMAMRCSTRASSP